MGGGLRPQFEAELGCSSTEAYRAICERLETTRLIVRRTRVPGGGREVAPRASDHVVVTVPRTEQHFWSPWLTVEISPRDARTHILARFSPHPSVWTGFAFGYLCLGFIATVALTIGAAGMVLPRGAQPWAWWVAGAAVATMTGLWIASQIGQRLAREQMAILRGELERAVAACRESP